MIISVIVPVYNVADKLERCVQSILTQAFSDFELLLVNDGSTDGSGELCDRLADTDSRIRVIHQSNKGASAARNHGIDEAQGEYIAFVDSDDYVDTDYLRAMYDTAVKNGSDLVICGVNYCNYLDATRYTPQTNRGNFRLKVSPDSGREIAELIDDRRFNYIYAKLYKRETIFSSQLRFDESLSLGEDTVFVLQYLKHIDTIDIIGESHYYYIKYPSGTLSSCGKENQYVRLTGLNNRLENILIESGLWQTEIRISMEKRHILSAYWCVSAFNEMNMSRKSKVALIDSILKTKELVAACQNDWGKKSDLPYADMIRRGDARKLLNKMKTVQIKNRLKEKAISILRAITPHFIKRLRKNRKHNA
ncbi:MAG: glycosyltransferase family 2 protein [Clostridia bacterium]|nr:glycosyltransferase family 2 protein [Clostridia bacterium]